MAIRGARRPRKVAVFDIDGTIFRSSLLIELVEGLIATGIFPTRARRMYEAAHRKWLDREGSYEKYIMAVVEAFLQFIGGVREPDLRRVVTQVIAVHSHRVYRYTRDLVHALRRKGYFLLAISHSPKYVAGKFGSRMGFHKTYGTLLELDPKTKRFTGKRLYEDIIFDKAKILRRAVEKEGLTLRGSVGVGDTESDIPFLKLVAHPVCFNPNQALLRTAKRRGWSVVVERKDVVYKMKK
jgi:HAD superfamily hydrolase (TIGR01490 family)